MVAVQWRAKCLVFVSRSRELGWFTIAPGWVTYNVQCAFVLVFDLLAILVDALVLVLVVVLVDAPALVSLVVFCVQVSSVSVCYLHCLWWLLLVREFGVVWSER